MATKRPQGRTRTGGGKAKQIKIDKSKPVNNTTSEGYKNPVSDRYYGTEPFEKMAKADKTWERLRKKVKAAVDATKR